MAIQKYSSEKKLKESRANFIKLDRDHIKPWAITVLRKRRLWAQYYFSEDD